MAVICGVCGFDVHDHEDICVRCTTSQGFPNVRLAQKNEERQALVERAELGLLAAKSAGADIVLSRAVQMAENAPIAFNRSIQQMFRWCEAADQNFRPWLWHVKQGLRVYPDAFNSGRLAFEHNVNPNYAAMVNFGYLDTGGARLSRYGAVTVRFRSDAVRHRTTFLETNSYYFCHKHGVVDPSMVPKGYRCIWSDVHLLVAAKLGSIVRPSISKIELAGLLLREGDQSQPEDFLEAHIYNPLHVSSIESISCSRPSSTEQPLLQYVRSVLEPIGVKIEIRP